MSNTIKAIIKRPRELFGHTCHIAPTLKNLQMKVGGKIEVVRPYGAQFVIICNEEGKLNGMDPNIKIPGDFIVGPVIAVGVDGEDFADIPISFDYWRNQLALWGN